MAMACESMPVLAGALSQFVDYIDEQTGCAHYGTLIVTPGLTADWLARAYFQMRAEGILPVVFFNEEPDIASFLRWFTRPEAVVCGCFRDSVLRGLGWVSAQEKMGNYRKAEVGMAFFRNRGPDALAFARMMLTLVFERYPIDFMYGTTPASNKLAIRFARKLGFTITGPLPNYCLWKDLPCGAYISSLSRDDFRRLERS